MDNNYMKTILSGIKEWTRSLIQKAADTAQTTADTAQAVADNAQAVADNAQAVADNAQAAADTAQAAADTAQATADNALHPQILYDDQILIWDGTTTATESTVQVKYFTYVSALDSTKKTRYYRISNISDNVVKYALAHYEDIKCATKVQNGTENEMELIDNWYVDSSGLCVSCEDYYIIIVGESGSHVARFPGVTLPFRIDFPQAGIYIGYCTDSSVEGDAGKSFTHKIALPTYGLPLNSVILTTDSDKNIQIVDTETGTKKTLKSAYAYAQDGGYTGTEAEFAAKLAAEKLPNPHPLTFTGAVSETYDGSSAKTIEIPSGGSGGETIIAEETVLASGTIATETEAYAFTASGITFGMLRNYKHWTVEFKSASQSTHLAAGYKIGSVARYIGRLKAKNIKYQCEWLDKEKTIIRVFAVSGSGYGYGVSDISQSTNNSAQASMSKQDQYIIADVADDTVLGFFNHDALTNDILWRVKGVIKYGN